MAIYTGTVRKFSLGSWGQNDRKHQLTVHLVVELTTEESVNIKVQGVGTRLQWVASEKVIGGRWCRGNKQPKWGRVF